MDCYIGLMSGTSIDAIDAVLVDFAHNPPRCLATYTHSWPLALQNTLLELSQTAPTDIPLATLAPLNRTVGELLAAAALGVWAKGKGTQIKAIGSAGQTLYHSPNSQPAYTYQLGDASTLAELTTIPVVSDFRLRDVAAGGQGAPLAPLFHQAFFAHHEETRVIVNIGGIANITVLIPHQPVIGFDTGPGNALLNAWIFHHYQRSRDEAGQWASQGKVNTQLLNDLLQDPYFAKPAPKSTGRDYFNDIWLKNYITNNDLPPEDVQATLLALTVQTIVNAITPYQPQRVLVCGGGVHNPPLMNGLQKGLNCPVNTTQTAGIEPDWLEAMGFAWLAKQRLEQRLVDTTAITGAQHPLILGSITL